MSGDVNGEEFNALVQAVFEADDETARRRAEQEVFRVLQTSRVLTNWARGYARTFNIRDAGKLADLEQVIAERVLLILRRDDIASRPPRSWLGLLHRLCRNAIFDWLASAENTPASGMSGVYRKRRTAGVAMEDFRHAHGREPTVTELSEITGISVDLLNAGDTLTPSGVPLHPTEESDERRGHTPAVEDEYDIYATDLAHALVSFTKSFIPEDIMLHHVAHVWAEMISSGDTPTARTVSAELGLGERDVRQALDRLPEVLAAFQRHWSR